MAVQTSGQGQVQAQWVIDPMVVPAPANQFLVQASGDETGASAEVVLNFGYFSPPLVNLPGASQAEIEQAMASSIFPVPAVARVTMSRGRLIELHTKISEILAATDGDQGQ
ncbi:hypothetical protein ACFVTX_04735 [Agromyces sp. NPDC058136]|uniref:hypothetical protein n=1 Tax=Agromyces sp. NPDC058136 TaxID=3346354 RepID=UPI0036DD9E00